MGALIVPACTDSKLEPVATTVPPVDDELTLEGELCPSPPADALFPVKVLFLVDTSLSMSVTDRGGIRAQAVAKVMQRYAGYPGVEFGVIAFDARIDVLTKGFTDNPDVAAITTRLATADHLTDYQGVLGAAYTFLTNDIVKSSPAERARSKYVVVFFSDGTPDPQCSSTTTPCGSSTCPAHQHCSVNKCAADYLICSVAREDWSKAFDPPVDPSLYPQLEQGADYNQPEQIFRAVDEIVALQDFFRVGEIRLHTGFLFDPAAASDPLAAPFGLDRAAGVALLTQVAAHGRGDFTEFQSASQISFLNIDYTSFKEDNDLVAFIATDSNTIETGTALASDTDGDGLSDDDETKLTTCVGASAKCADPTDTDQDGYSDFVEDHNRPAGFDPMDPAKPQLTCADRGDSDGDGLRDCEEEFFKTDPRNADTDGDRVSDRMELLNGLDPLDPSDAVGDINRNGTRNQDELRAHLSVAVAASDAEKQRAYLYDVAPVTKPDGRKCYHFDVEHVRLLTTGRGTDSTLGKNRILLYVDEAPVTSTHAYGQFRVACVDTRYVDGAFRSPLGGSVHFEDTDFVDIARFDPAKNCRDLTNASGADGGSSAADGGRD